MRGVRDRLEAMLVYYARGVRRLRARVPVTCVGGSTLGGTGKTPVAIAIAQAMARAGASVSLIGHAYRANPGRARVVRPGDSLFEVGDEALVCARALDGLAEVVVAPTRQAAIELAERRADHLVIDGVLQLAPERAALSILTTPAGRAPRPLARLSDRVIRAHVEMDADWSSLRSCRVGLVTCLARPARIVQALRDKGVLVARHLALRNHGPGWRVPLGDADVDVWVATEKCALHVSGPVIVLRARATLPLDLGLAPPYPENVVQGLESVVMPRI